MLKFLLLIGGLAALYYGYRYVQRREAEKAEARLRSQQAQPPQPANAAPPRSGSDSASEDITACAVCGTYRPVSAKACERADCPAPRA